MTRPAEHANLLQIGAFRGAACSKAYLIYAGVLAAVGGLLLVVGSMGKKK
jgi:hypothetical protein